MSNNSFLQHIDDAISFSTTGPKLTSGTTDPSVLAAGSNGDIYFYTGTGPSFIGLYLYKTSLNSWINIPSEDVIDISIELVTKAAAQAASTTNLNATYNNGSSGVGATLTNAGTEAAFVIDGYAASVNDRILIKDQTDETQNGIYVVTTVGNGSTDWVLTRSTDFDTPSNAVNGSYVLIDGGTVNLNSGWIFAFPSGSVVFGTTDIVWNKFTQFNIAAGNGITISSGKVNVNYDGVTLGITPTQLSVISSATANQLLISAGSTSSAASWSSMTDAIHGNLDGGSLHALATDSLAGFMSASDKTKLDSVTIVGGQIQLANGSATSPSYSFVNSTNTGMFLDAAGDLEFSAGGFSLLELKYSTAPGSVTAYAPIYQSDGNFSTTGDAKSGQYILRNTTTTATPSQLYIDGATKQITLTSTNATIFSFEAFVTAIQTVSPYATMGWRIAGGIQQTGGLASSTAIIGTVSVDTLFDSSGGTLDWATSATADTVNGALMINITGAASTSIKWLGRVNTTETMT